MVDGNGLWLMVMGYPIDGNGLWLMAMGYPVDGKVCDVSAIMAIRAIFRVSRC
jgi:hypothetical protein